MMEYDVIIVGAGPAGASAALVSASLNLKTLVVEKKKIPRQKACSGILVPASLTFLRNYFGDLPDEIFSRPKEVRSMRMHFGGGRVVDATIGGLMVWRDRLDEWLCRHAGAEILDGTTLETLVEKDDGVELLCRDPDGEKLSMRCRVLIAADGGPSTVVRLLEPVLHKRLRWYVALQDIYECSCNLEPGLFHFFARPEISPYLSAYVKDDRLVMDVVVSVGQRATDVMDRFRAFLWPRVGVEKASLAGRLGCRVTYAAPRGLFCFGTHRVLVAGEASGLLNNFGEGISSALASGLIAGRAAERGLREGVPPGRIYREEIEGEKRKTLNTFDYRRFLFGKSSAIHFGARSVPLSWRERIGLAGDVVRWLLRMRKSR